MGYLIKRGKPNLTRLFLPVNLRRIICLGVKLLGGRMVSFRVLGAFCALSFMGTPARAQDAADYSAHGPGEARPQQIPASNFAKRSEFSFTRLSPDGRAIALHVDTRLG
ncbi:MAG: hypothetical protein VYA25_04890, partial [Pseudomonadota bacterium]|nr:hypothetical protein [Pseudomonadota bacterium]